MTCCSQINDDECLVCRSVPMPCTGAIFASDVLGVSCAAYAWRGIVSGSRPGVRYLLLAFNTCRCVAPAGDSGLCSCIEDTAEFGMIWVLPGTATTALLC
jgi:hypothetical protein